jgi:hypothetical protein
MLVILILLMYMWHMNKEHFINSIDMMDFCLRAASFGCLNSPCVILLVSESHCGGFMGHFGVHKTYDMLNEHFCWHRDVEKVCNACVACRQAKSKFMPHGFYKCLYLYLVHLGLMYLRILCLGCLELGEVGIAYLLWLIGLARWLILLLVINVMLLLILLTYSLEKLCVYMVFHAP